jgi:hypothetical protein
MSEKTRQSRSPFFFKQPITPSVNTAELAPKIGNPRQKGSETRIGSKQPKKFPLFYSCEEAEGTTVGLDLVEIR